MPFRARSRHRPVGQGGPAGLARTDEFGRLI
jgi:hypothetical protein